MSEPAAPARVAHLAIPSHDLTAAAGFYGAGLQCRIARRYEDRITVDFFGMQLVCHLTRADDPSMAGDPRMYPRHFGATFRHREDYDAVLARATGVDLLFFKRPFARFAGKTEEHETFFLQDPSKNLLEFKWYRDASMMY